LGGERGEEWGKGRRDHHSTFSAMASKRKKSGKELSINLPGSFNNAVSEGKRKKKKLPSFLL